MDGIIDTVSAFHPIAPLLLLLKARGRMILVGVPNKPLELPSFCLIQGMHLLSFYRTASKVLFFGLDQIVCRYLSLDIVRREDVGWR